MKGALEVVSCLPWQQQVKERKQMSLLASLAVAVGRDNKEL